MFRLESTVHCDGMVNGLKHGKSRLVYFPDTGPQTLVVMYQIEFIQPTQQLPVSTKTERQWFGKCRPCGDQVFQYIETIFELAEPGMRKGSGIR